MLVWIVNSNSSGKSNEEDHISVQIPAGQQKMDRLQSSSSFLQDGKDGPARLVKTKDTLEALMKLELFII
jgi:hypothetical protein